VRVVVDVTLHVDPAEMVALVGRNGAGKTTSLLSIAGLRYGPGSGTVRLGENDISRASPHEIVRLGLSLVPEGHRIFKEMTVQENLELGAFPRRRSDRARIQPDIARVCDLFPALGEYRGKQVGQLSGGQQQMVAVGQALMSQPSFLLLDEPMAGLSPGLVDEMYERLRELVSGGIGILIVDQSVDRVLEKSDRFAVMDNGRIALSGSSQRDALTRVNEIVLGMENDPLE
jgi:branched-chain amino acid transport system ATP-binding protein